MIKLLLLSFLIITAAFTQETSSMKTQKNIFHNFELEDEILLKTNKLLLFPIDVYQKQAGKIILSRCQMYPSCSVYSREAINNYGLYGLVMMFDRLHRCGHDLNWYSRVLVKETIKYYDPVD